VKAFTSESNFRGCINALDQAGYCSGRLIYSQSLMNYCYAMYLLMDQENIPLDKRTGLIGRWITMSLLTGHYQNSPDTVVQRDYQEIRSAGFESYLKQIEELRLSEDFFDNILPSKYMTTTARTAPYIAFNAALCARGAGALYSSVSMREVFSDKPESYQLLPKAYLEKCGFKTREIYGQVGNISYITKDMKAVLRKKIPADYRESLLQEISEEQISQSLKEHGIPDQIFEADKSNVEEILLARRRNIARIMKDYYYSL